MSEGEDVRRELESLLHGAGVDFAFTGHVHAYERTHPMYQNKSHACGTVHITIGDGGNREGFAYDWATPATPSPPLYDQPEWSAYREFSFGHGRLRLHNASHAEWQWFKNDFGNKVVSDSTSVIRSNKCDQIAV